MKGFFDPTATAPRSRSMAGSAAPQPCLIERARVMTVNIRDFTVDVRTEFTYKPKFDIPFMTPYCNASQGEGINLMPEVGSVCWVCTPSEEGREAFVLGWTMPDDHGSYRAGREILNPGDIHLSTRDKNFVTVRRGGIVQIGATPVCQRIFLPIRNIIQDFAENYEMHTPAGDLSWEVKRKEDDGEGHQACLYTLSCKEFADDEDDGGKKPLAVLKIGSHGDKVDTILTLQTLSKGGGEERTTLTIGKTGDITWTMKKGDFSQTLEDGSYSLTVKKGSITITAADGDEGEFQLDAKKTVTLKSGKAMTLQSEDTFDVKSAKAMTLKTDAAGKVEAASELVLKAPVVKIGDAQFPVARDSPDFQIWVAQVSAAMLVPTVPGVAIGPGVVPPVQYSNPLIKV